LFISGSKLGSTNSVFGLVVGLISMLIGAGSVGPQWGAIMQSIKNGVEPQIQSNLFVDLIASAFSILVVTPLSTIFTYLMYKSLKEIKGEYTHTAK
jgi:mannitol-specific phosphotransferase system IIBC component